MLLEQDNALLLPANQNRTLLSQASILLHQQWPRGGSIADYADKLEQSDDDRLPQSYLLVLDSSASSVIGHGRLTECCTLEGNGKAVAATYIVIHPDYRGLGWGKVLMKALEEVARGMQYHYMYLWTTTAVEFYKKLGYQRTCRVSLQSACLKTLETSQVGRLEAMLAKQRGIQRPNETVMLPPEDDNTSTEESDVWLRKRLLESLTSFHTVSFDQRKQELQCFANQHPSLSRGSSWHYKLHADLPWQNQVGPSCGLTCLRMLRERYAGSGRCHTGRLSLLQEARRRGFSVDGEMFDVQNLQTMATYFGLETSLCSVDDLSPQKVFQLLQESTLIVLSYDSQHVSKLPFQASGHHAHYGVCVGMMVETSRHDDPTEAATLVQLSEESVVGPPSAVWLVVQQSLSLPLVIAPLETFVASNRQLKTVDAEKFPQQKEDMRLSGWFLACMGFTTDTVVEEDIGPERTP